MYLIRLDDAAENLNIDNWIRMEKLLDKYNIKPIYGIIPKNEDEELLKYNKCEEFYNIIKRWNRKEWTPALHGYNHKFITNSSGINPVNKKSEFAGINLTEQRYKIKEGIKILNNLGIYPKIFFAPAHTFDENTLIALKKESNIKVISDMIANDIFFENDFWFIPQQSGKCRKLPFKLVTFCYHPNVMNEYDFQYLEEFLKKNINKFGSFKDIEFKKRKRNIFDYLINRIYFLRK